MKTINAKIEEANIKMEISIKLSCGGKERVELVLNSSSASDCVKLLEIIEAKNLEELIGKHVRIRRNAPDISLGNIVYNKWLSGFKDKLTEEKSNP